jgi:protein-S-isoprenylcysteine O-methyltransferase Ste14
MHSGRLQWITAIVMAYAVMLILVSPAVPSPATTLRTKQTVQPPHFIAPVTALLFTSAVDLIRAAAWVTTGRVQVLANGPEIIDLTTVRLC